MGGSQSVWLRIDFGVEETTAALLGVDGVPRPLRLTDHAAAMPSGVYLSPSAGLEVGAVARERGADDPNRYVAEPKRWIDGGRPVCELGGTAVPVHVVVAAVLRAVIARAQAECGWQLPAGLVLGHPPRWMAAQVQVLVAAAIEAGYPPDRLRLVPEMPESMPAAAGFAPGPTTPGTPDHQHPTPPVPNGPFGHAPAGSHFAPGWAAPPMNAAPSRRSAWLALLIVAAVVLLIGSVVTGVVVLRSEDAPAAQTPTAPPHRTIAVGASQGVGYTVADPFNDRVYTANTLDNTVSVIDTVAEKTIASVPMGFSPRAMAVDFLKRTLWVLGGKSGNDMTMAKIDCVTNTVVGTATVPANTREIAVHHGTSEVYVSQANGEVVDPATGSAVVASIVDPITLQITGRILAPGHGVDIAINPNSGQIYINDGRNVKIIDRFTKSVVGQVDSPDGGDRMVVDPTTKTAFLSSGTKIVLLDLTDGTHIRTIDLGYRVYWLAIDPAAGNVYAPESGATGTARLTVIDIPSRAIKGVIEMSSSAEGIAADLMSRKVYVRPLDSYVYVIDPCASVQCR